VKKTERHLALEVGLQVGQLGGKALVLGAVAVQLAGGNALAAAYLVQLRLQLRQRACQPGALRLRGLMISRCKTGSKRKRQHCLRSQHLVQRRLQLRQRARQSVAHCLMIQRRYIRDAVYTTRVSSAATAGTSLSRSACVSIQSDASISVRMRKEDVYSAVLIII